MGKKNRYLLIADLNIWTLPVVILARIFFERIYYFRVAKYFLVNSFFIFLLKFFDLEALSYEKSKKGIHAFFSKVIPETSLDYFKKNIENSSLFLMLENDFQMDHVVKNKLRAATINILSTRYFDNFQILYFAKKIQANKKGKRLFLFASNNHFTGFIFRRNKLPILNLCPLDLSFFSYLSRASYLLLNKLKNLFRVFPQKPGNDESKEGTKGHSSFKRKGISDYEILFFSNKDIIGDLFSRDHFYSDDPQSPFFYSNILHVYLKNPVDLSEAHCNFFKENAIPSVYFYAFENKKDFFKFLLKGMVRFLSHPFCCIKNFHRTGFFSLTLIFFIYFSIQRNLKLISHFKNAKIALIWYEVLFCRLLSVALALKGIKTVATQERFLLTWKRDHGLNLDHYFVAGEVVKEQLQSCEDFFSIGNIFPIGLLRSDLIRDKSNLPAEDKYLKIKKSYFLILALDIPIELTANENRLGWDTQWSNIKRFYRDLIRLSFDFPKAYIVIKGKNTNVLRHPEFSELVNLIENLPNICIETNLAYYSPYKMATLVDAAVAIHTSLGEEMLARGKQVIFYDFYAGLPTSFFDYEGAPIFAFNYQQLADKVDKIIKGHSLMPQEIFDNFRMRFFSSYPPGNVRDKLREQLIEIHKSL
ncbi:hypothetical protein ACFL35_08385 [Candidatus Riflebacteria bacterium]